MKKKYSRKKVNYQKASRSGAGEKDIRTAKKDLEEYSFLLWLDDHTRLRKTKSNLGDIGESQAEENTQVAEEFYEEETRDSREELEEDEDSDDEMENELKSPTTKRKFVASKKLSNKPKVTAHALMGAELDVMKNFSRALKEKSSTTVNKDLKQDDDDDLFGKIIAAEVRKFPEAIKFRVKHEINNVIFNYKVRQTESVSDLTIPLQSPSASSASLSPVYPPNQPTTMPSPSQGTWFTNMHTYMH